MKDKKKKKKKTPWLGRVLRCMRLSNLWKIYISFKRPQEIDSNLRNVALSHGEAQTWLLSVFMTLRRRCKSPSQPPNRETWVLVSLSFSIDHYQGPSFMGSHPAYLASDFHINPGERSVSLFITTSQGPSNSNVLHVLSLLCMPWKISSQGA